MSAFKQIPRAGNSDGVRWTNCDSIHMILFWTVQLKMLEPPRLPERTGASSHPASRSIHLTIFQIQT